MKYSLRSLMRFSLRDLFWITVVVAVVLGWWVDHMRGQERELRWWKCVQEMSNELASAPEPYAFETPNGILRINVNLLPVPSASAPNPPKDLGLGTRAKLIP